MAHHGEEFTLGAVCGHGGFLGINQIPRLFLLRRDVNRRADRAERAADFIAENHGAGFHMPYPRRGLDAIFLPVRAAVDQASAELRFHRRAILFVDGLRVAFKCRLKGCGLGMVNRVHHAVPDQYVAAHVVVPSADVARFRRQAETFFAEPEDFLGPLALGDIHDLCHVVGDIGVAIADDGHAGQSPHH